MCSLIAQRTSRIGTKNKDQRIYSTLTVNNASFALGFSPIVWPASVRSVSQEDEMNPAPIGVRLYILLCLSVAKLCYVRMEYALAVISVSIPSSGRIGIPV